MRGGPSDTATGPGDATTDDTTAGDATASDPERSPEEAFAALGNERRLDVLYTLWEAHDPPGPTPLSFSALQERTGMADSGNFNYHLDALVGTFVERRDDGYALSEAGQSVVRSILAGTTTDDRTLDAVAIEEPCPVCGTTLTISYRGVVLVRCPDCAGLFPDGEYPRGTIGAWPLEPAGVRNRTPEEVFEAALARLLVDAQSMIAGVCPACSGVPVLSVRVCETHDPGESGVCPECANPARIATDHVCENCKYYVQTGAWAHALFHQATIAFLHDHGVDIDLTSRAYHERAFECREEVVSFDPLRIEVTVPTGDDALRVTLDGNMTVVDTNESRSATK